MPPTAKVYQLTTDLTAVADSATPQVETTSWGSDTPLAHRNGQAVLVDTAATVGLGLAGAGAAAAVRALLISILATDDTAAMWITSPVRDQLLGVRRTSITRSPSGSSPAGLASGRVVVQPDLDRLLDLAETELVTRTRLLESSSGTARPSRLVLVVDTPEDSHRLRAVAANGLGLGITVIALGFWRPGITCCVAADGRIQNVAGDDADSWPLAGLTAFTASQQDAHTLLGLLGHIEPVLPTPRVVHEPPSQRVAPAPGSELAPPDSPHHVSAADHEHPADHVSSPDPHRITRLLTPDESRPETPPATRSAPTGQGPSPSADLPVEATTPQITWVSPKPMLTLSVLGEVVLEWSHPEQPRDITGKFMPKFQEVLVYLALHPQGARRDRLSATIWPNANAGGRPFNSFHSALSQIRALATRATNGQSHDFIEREGDRYRLNADIIATDYQRFQRLVAAHHGPIVHRPDVEPLTEAVALPGWNLTGRESVVTSSPASKPSFKRCSQPIRPKLLTWHIRHVESILTMKNTIVRLFAYSPGLDVPRQYLEPSPFCPASWST